MNVFPHVFAIGVLVFASIMICASIYLTRKVSPQVRATSEGRRSLAIVWLIAIFFMLRALLSVVITFSPQPAPALAIALSLLMAVSTLALIVLALISFINSRRSLYSAYNPVPKNDPLLPVTDTEKK